MLKIKIIYFIKIDTVTFGSTLQFGGITTPWNGLVFSPAAALWQAVLFFYIYMAKVIGRKTLIRLRIIQRIAHGIGQALNPLRLLEGLLHSHGFTPPVLDTSVAHLIFALKLPSFDLIHDIDVDMLSYHLLLPFIARVILGSSVTRFSVHPRLASNQ